MKKIFISIISLTLAAAFLIGCTPAKDIMAEATTKPQGILILPNESGVETEFKDYVVCSANFAFYTDEYNYFFMKIYADTLKGKESEYGVDPEKSLKTQYVSNSEKTWFEVLRDMTLDYMKELLYVYELALDADKGHISKGDSYIYDQFVPMLKAMSDGKPADYVYEQFGDAVSYQSYLNAVRMERICELYTDDLIAKKAEALTGDEIKKYADGQSGEKDESLTRKAVCVSVSGGKVKAEELKESFTAGGSLTSDALKALAKEKGHYCFEYTFVPKNAVYTEIADWLFQDGRAEGDTAPVEVKNDGYYLVFYAEKGEAVYLHNARNALARETVESEIKSGAAKYKFNTDAEKLNNVNV